jgi:hypothetical protein
MKSFFDPAAQKELQSRVQKLDAKALGQWGKMTAAQMLAHCTATMQVPVGDLTLKKNLLSLIGWMFKGMLVSDKPFGRNSPTAPEYKMKDEKVFDEEIKRFQETFNKLARGPSAVKCWNHPFFGKMTADDWGHLMYKHLDHHLTQFGL